MDDQILKGNFKTKNDISQTAAAKKTSKEEYKENVLASIGGSMVYMDKTEMTWDGDEDDSK